MNCSLGKNLLFSCSEPLAGLKRSLLVFDFLKQSTLFKFW